MDERLNFKKWYSVRLTKCPTGSGSMGSRFIRVPDYWVVVLEPYGIEVKVCKSEEEAKAYAQEKNQSQNK